MSWKAYVVALGTIAAGVPAFANTASDNIVWSAKQPSATMIGQPECTAYTHQPIAGTSDATSDPLAKTLKVVGTMAALAAVSVATKATTTSAPNPCGSF
ncbi:hypothetical protein WN982_16495 [Paraburkholderia sp. IMGN_8]|uniref:hypothetical protein n=1 Tax=Paraburkholderia sp. IMGN_8 TaxID=3136564 RepID=UPI003100E194